MSTIAFIGLGNMGAPMAANLIAAGHTVRGFDPHPAHAHAAGVPVLPSATEAVRGADAIITMLPTGALVEAVYDEILPHVIPEALVIDSSTIAVAEAQVLAARGRRNGLRPADAPVSGGVPGATAGTLTFMVGADAADLPAVSAVLRPMAGKIVACGQPGAGQAAKVCNNLILAISMVGVSEAFVLGAGLGLSSQTLFDVTSTSTAQCWSINNYCPVSGPVPDSPANRDYAPGFAATLMAKDLRLAMEAADHTGTATRVGRLVEHIFRDFASTNEGAGLDFSGIITEIESLSAQPLETG